MANRKKTVADWMKLNDHVNHVQTVLTDNGKTEYIRFNINPLVDQANLGRRTDSIYNKIEAALCDAKDEFPTLFFDEPAKKRDETKKGGKE